MYNLNWIIIGLLTLASTSSLALETDKNLEAHLFADSADLNQQTHQGLYLGHVKVDQGTTHLRAIKALTKGNQQNKLIFAQAFGTTAEPAHFWTKTDEAKPPLHAYALEITYYPERHLILLSGNARIEQGEDSLSAPKITYNTKEKHVISQGNDKERTTIIFHQSKPHE